MKWIPIFAAALLFGSPALAQTATYNTGALDLHAGDQIPLQVDSTGRLKTTAGTGTTADQTQGNVAHDAADSGAPVKFGCYASAAAPVAVADADRVNAWCTNNGALNVVPQGNVANDAPDAGAPLKIGGAASSGAQAAVTQGDRVNAWYGLVGNQTITFGTRAAAIDGNANTSHFASLATDGNAAFLGVYNYAMNTAGTWDRVRGDANGLVVQPGLTGTSWSYSNGATGILSNTTTAVTIKTAAGASVRNFIDSCTINSTAFGAAVPFAIRDGAGGTVLFALNVPTTGFTQPVTINFNMPLRGTANTLLEVVTTTANTSGTVWVNCQGHTGL